MNYYDFHIGDYASRTAHLEPMEDLAYRRMLDLYYLRERELPKDMVELSRLLRMRGHEQAIEAVLSEFFIQTETGWGHRKCQEVIELAQEKREKAAASAEKRWQSDRNANAQRPQSGGNAPTQNAACEGNAPTSHNPIPTTHRGAIAPKPGDVGEQVWRDFIKTRKTKVTETALSGIRKQAELAGMTLEQALEVSCERGWQSFKAEWVRDRQQGPPRVSNLSERRAQTIAGLTNPGAHHAEHPNRTIDVAAKVVG